MVLLIQFRISLAFFCFLSDTNFVLADRMEVRNRPFSLFDRNSLEKIVRKLHGPRENSQRILAQQSTSTMGFLPGYPTYI